MLINIKRDECGFQMWGHGELTKWFWIVIGSLAVATLSTYLVDSGLLYYILSMVMSVFAATAVQSERKNIFSESDKMRYINEKNARLNLLKDFRLMQDEVSMLALTTYVPEVNDWNKFHSVSILQNTKFGAPLELFFTNGDRVTSESRLSFHEVVKIFGKEEILEALEKRT